MYLYKTIIYKNTDNVGGLTLAERTQMALNKTDFETNHKATAIKVDEIILAETTFEIEKTYAQFEALLTGDLTWADVKYKEIDNIYVINLLI